MTRHSSLPPSLKKTISAEEYRYLKQCQEQFEDLADWLLAHLSHQIGMGDLVHGESAVAMVKRLLRPLTDPGYMMHFALSKNEGGIVLAEGSLWDPKHGVVTAEGSINDVLESLKEALSLYSEEIEHRWGSEVLTGQWGPETAAYFNLLSQAANDLFDLLVEQGQEGLVQINVADGHLVVILERGTGEYKGPWFFGERNIRVLVERAETEDPEEFEELPR